ncbi:PAS domain-containing protein [Desulfosarcina widdelii]|nr:PAS domain S-box protein [Desulfosarcina widdelii]
MKINQCNASTSKTNDPPPISDNPLRILCYVAVTIFIVEFVLMVLLDYMPSIPHYQEAFIDAFVLTMLVFPTLYIFVVKPLTQNISMRERLEKENIRLVADLKKAIAQLQLSEKKLKGYFDHATDSIFIIDPDTDRILDCNIVAYEKLGYSKEEMLQLTVGDLNKKVQLNERKKLFERQISGENICFETCHTRKDGSDFPVEVTSAMLVDEGKKVLQSIVRDISERREREEEREQLIAELKNALDEIKTLRGILPICSFCKKIRNDKGYWEQVEVYISKNSSADISHSICPECLKKEYPEFSQDVLSKIST